MQENKLPERGYVDQYNEALAELETLVSDDDSIELVESLPTQAEAQPVTSDPAAPEAEPEVDQPVEQEQEIPDWKAEIEAANAANRVWQEQVIKQIQQLLPSQPAQPAPQPPQPQQPQYEDPYMVALQRQQQHLAWQQGELRKLHESNSRREYSEAVRQLQAKYPDLHEHVPVQALEHAYGEAVKQGHFNVPWQQDIENQYRIRSWDKVRARADEVGAKREEKRQKSTAAAAQVPSGGATFQKAPPAEQPTTRRDFSYRTSAAAMEAELAQFMQG